QEGARAHCSGVEKRTADDEPCGVSATTPDGQLHPKHSADDKQATKAADRAQRLRDLLLMRRVRRTYRASLNPAAADQPSDHKVRTDGHPGKDEGDKVVRVEVALHVEVGPNRIPDEISVRWKRTGPAGPQGSTNCRRDCEGAANGGDRPLPPPSD